jgi:hypothetical protein
MIQKEERKESGCVHDLLVAKRLSTAQSKSGVSVLLPLLSVHSDYKTHPSSTRPITGLPFALFTLYDRISLFISARLPECRPQPAAV